MKKLAVCFFGFHYMKYLNNNIRKHILVDFEKSVENYNTFIFDYFKKHGYEIDVFFSTYKSDKQDKLIEIYKPKKYIIHTKIIQDRHISRNFNFRTCLNLVLKYQKEREIKYDNIIITRFDLKIKIPLDKTNLQLDKFNIVSNLENKKLIDDNFYIITGYNLARLARLSYYDKSFHYMKKKFQKNFNLNYIYNQNKNINLLSFYDFVRTFV